MTSLYREYTASQAKLFLNLFFIDFAICDLVQDVMTGLPLLAAKRILKNCHKYA